MSLKLEKIDNMGEFCDIMKSFGHPTRGLNTLDQMKSRLSEVLSKILYIRVIYTNIRNVANCLKARSAKNEDANVHFQ